MEQQGFVFKHGFKIFDVYEQTPACVAQKQGRAVSLRQLEALPFAADSGFHPIKPDSGMWVQILLFLPLERRLIYSDACWITVLSPKENSCWYVVTTRKSLDVRNSVISLHI
ncbi:Uncharacterised protein [Yersinia enterocolitica]|nr:Uncharacterised protein [Yersinia enterocolitica]CRY12489.1 Uncharacterised protein [Yersinia enterocolitica]